jgi:hypothetical protein
LTVYLQSKMTFKITKTTLNSGGTLPLWTKFAINAENTIVPFLYALILCSEPTRFFSKIGT